MHKATHHFDLVNWWLGAVPVAVRATGERAFYTPAMARRLGLGVVAEGIEDDATAASLLEMGCRYGQGYLYGKPMPAGPNLKTERKTGNLLGSPFEFKRYGKCGMEMTELLPNLGTVVDDIAFIRFIMPALEDPRYIRVAGKPLLLIYRSELFPNPAASIERWRNEARSAGLGDLFLVRCEGFDPYTDPESIGFDASYEVPTFILPDELKFEDRESLNVSPEFTGRIYDYKKIVDWYCRRPEAQYRRYRGPMLAWDNTPRHGKNALVFHGATPELYGQWIEDSLAHARRRFRGEERLVFVNAWNEWAEGSYLEPDLKFGNNFLKSNKFAVERASLAHRSSPIR